MSNSKVKSEELPVLVFRVEAEEESTRVFPYAGVIGKLMQGELTIVADISRQTASAATKILRKKMQTKEIYHTAIKLGGETAYLYFKS